MSGGKGGSQTSQVEIPQWIQQPSIRNMARAEALQKVGYQPYMGPDVAGLTSPQQQAMQANIDAASAFGLVDPGMSAMDGMPQTSQFGGVSGYSSYPMYQQAVDNYETANPGQARQYNNLFVNPQSGLGGTIGTGMMGGGINSGGQNNSGAGSVKGDPGDVGQFTAFDPTQYSIMDGNPYGVNFTAQAPDMSSYITADQLDNRFEAFDPMSSMPDLSNYAQMSDLYDDSQLRGDINSRFETFNPDVTMPDLSNYATNESVNNRFDNLPTYQAPDLSNYAQMSDLYNDTQLRQDMNNRFSNLPTYQAPDLSNYATNDALSAGLQGINQYDDTQLRQDINNRFSNLPTYQAPDLSGYATNESVNNQFNNLSQFDPSGLQGQINANQQAISNLPSYQAPDLGNYATKDQLIGLLSDIGTSSTGVNPSLYSDPNLGQNNVVNTPVKATTKKKVSTKKGAR